MAASSAFDRLPVNRDKKLKNNDISTKSNSG
jgi:hypothetical protein